MNTSNPATPLPSAPLQNLPAAISGYIAAANAGDTDAVAACFTEGAIVKDEGQERRGISAIVAWKEEVTLKYKPTAQVIRAEVINGMHVVTASVSGDFPGSPVELKYAFAMDGDKIARLDIAA
ncbi:MAG TPA: nuclear transport factor 2 family protein [Polaromonas sp.]